MSDDITLAELGRTVHRIEGKLDRATDDHEARIRKLERWVYAIPLTVVSALLSAAVMLAR